MPKLTDAELAAALEELPGWKVEDGMLTKQFEFGAYLSGLEFATTVGQEAERRDHHPDMLVTWRKVKVLLSTHSEGGITEKDTGLAKFIEESI